MTAITSAITSATATKVLGLLSHGLTSGLGTQEPGKMCVEAAICFALGLPHGDDPGCVLPALRKLKITINDAGWSSNTARANGLKRLALAQLGSDELNGADFVRRVSTMTIRVFVPLALRAVAGMKSNARHKDKLEAAALECGRNPTKKSAIMAKEAAADAASAAAAAYAYAAATASAVDAANAAASAAAAAAAAANAAAYAYAAAYAANAAAYAATAAAYAAYDADAKRDSVLASFCEHVVGILIEMKSPGCQWLGLTLAS